MARKGLGGHHGYDKSRNALEVLEMLDVLEPAKRWERAAYLRDVPCVDAPELLHLGYEVKDLLKAGYEEVELRDQEGVTEDELVRAREAVLREAQSQQKKARSLDRSLSGGLKKRTGSQVDVGVMQQRKGSKAASAPRRIGSKVAPESDSDSTEES